MSETPSETMDALPVSGESAILAGRYAEALYALAEKDNLVDAVAVDMRGLRRLWSECPEWRHVACDPRLNAAALSEASTQIVSMIGCQKLTSNFLMVVATNRRLSVLPLMIGAFLRLLAAHRNEHDVDVHSAQPLTETQRDNLAAALTKITGGKVHINLSEDRALLGGLTVKIGSTFIDASVKARLDQLERHLKTGAAA